MKKTLLLPIAFFFISIQFFAQDFAVYEIKGNNISEAKIPEQAKSLNEIAENLGYESPKYFTYQNNSYDDDLIITTLLKSFTAEPFAIILTEKSEDFPVNFIQNYFKDFNKKTNYRTYTLEGQLKDGIALKNLSSDYFSKLFNQNINRDDSYLDMLNNYLLTFENGILVKFSPIDGLNKWSRSFKDNSPKMFDKFMFEASKYFKGDQVKILDFINEQCTSFANIPNGYQNPYLVNFEHPNGYINFSLLKKIKYENKKDLNFEVFNTITLGEAKKTQANTYNYLSYIYKFDETGKLSEIIQ